VTFNRYDRILLGEDGKPQPSSDLKFNEMYTNDKRIQKILEPAANYVRKLQTITHGGLDSGYMR
jgi:hypothetical protein